MLTHEYQIEGMTCNHCVAKVKNALLKNAAVADAQVTLFPPVVLLTLKEQADIKQLQQLLDEAGNYVIKTS